jgi:hypothetical protein
MVPTTVTHTVTQRQASAIGITHLLPRWWFGEPMHAVTLRRLGGCETPREGSLAVPIAWRRIIRQGEPRRRVRWVLSSL